MSITIPDKAALREAFDAAVREIAIERPMLTNAFYTSIGTSVFEAGYQALQDFAAAERGGPAPPPRMHVVSAPAGGGKTSFSIALLAALVRLTEHKDERLSCLFITDQIERADDTYKQLARLLPDLVAIWTSDHDAKRPKGEKVKSPAAQFTVDQLSLKPAVVTTHAFFQGPRGAMAREWLVDGHKQPRALTLVDERPNESDVFHTVLSDAELVREYVQADEEHRDEVETHISKLVRFMHDRTHQSCDLEKPSDDEEAWSIRDALHWFRTEAAARYVATARAHFAKLNDGKTLPIEPVFGFAQSLAEGRAFLTRSHGGRAGTRFIGYESNLMLGHGMVLLDATADVDGVQQIVDHRVLQPTPRGRFANLEIVHLVPLIRERLSTFFKLAPNRRAYVEWMRTVIVEHMQPGQRALVVCKKALIDNENVPQDENVHNDMGGVKSDDPVYILSIEGRKLAFTHWGAGIGSNKWQDAEVVFLFDHFYKPRRVMIGDTQALRRHKATEGDLASMRTQNSRAPAVDALSEGNLLRWSKQMCLRGRARHFDADGVCGRQKLVCCDHDRLLLLRNVETLYPGAKVTVGNTPIGIGGQGTQKRKQNRPDVLLEYLSDPSLPNVVPADWIGQHLKRPWRDVSNDVMKIAGIREALEALGWRYVSKRGRGGSRFERIPGEPQGEALLMENTKAVDEEPSSGSCAPCKVPSYIFLAAKALVTLGVVPPPPVR